jgi:hypothetical protein
MNKKTLSSLLLLLAVAAVIYAIYKGTEVTQTTIENGRTIIYGQPQDGLTLGLGVFAGLCVLSAALLAMDERHRVSNDAASAHTTTTAGSKVATNYPR